MGQTTLAGNKDWLYEDILKELGRATISQIGIPKEIKDNLNPNFPLREYQEKAFQMFISYFEQYQEKPIPRAVLFNMATGSGKTLIMAGLINYLYKKAIITSYFSLIQIILLAKQKKTS